MLVRVGNDKSAWRLESRTRPPGWGPRRLPESAAFQGSNHIQARPKVPESELNERFGHWSPSFLNDNSKVAKGAVKIPESFSMSADWIESIEAHTFDEHG